MIFCGALFYGVITGVYTCNFLDTRTIALQINTLVKIFQNLILFPEPLFSNAGIYQFLTYFNDNDHVTQ